MYLPPGIDPTTVDYRTFYPYIPNEVKHRKRTTRQQLKVLEDIFSRDTKPNAALRKTLAAELAMTPRGVQVWFQNRRAKEKALSKKATAAKTGTPLDLAKPFADDADPLDPEPSDSLLYPAPALDTPTQPSPTLPYRHISASPIPKFAGQDSDDSHLLTLRRGSLPAIAYPNASPPFVDIPDPLARRRSVDTSLQRLASHPYAHLALAKNGMLYASRASRLSASPELNAGHPAGFLGGRPNLSHRASMPHVLANRSRFYNTSGGASPLSRSPSRTAHIASRTSLPDGRLFAVTSRTVSSPIPGPLPSPNFSFGAPSGTENDSDPPDFSSFSFSRQTDEYDNEDDATSASYDAFSRFGSIASMASSESSAYYSDVPVEPECYEQNLRRASCASGHFVELMSGLDVSGLPHDAAPYPAQSQGMPNGTNGTTSYPSPTSTASPGDSPGPGACLPGSTSGELAYALRSGQAQQQNQNTNTIMDGTSGGTAYDASATVDVAKHDGPFAYAPDSIYPESASSSSSSSSLSLPHTADLVDKFTYGAGGANNVPGPYAYPEPGAFFAADGAYADQYGHCAPPTEIYPPYNTEDIDSYATYT